MDEIQKAELWEQFKLLESKAITMNHYDLARVTSIKDVQLWKKFLIDPEVTRYIDQESQLLTQAELRKLTQDVSDSRSVGQAQLINAMQKLNDNKTTKEGPIFIYTYIPLSENQSKANNIHVESEDIFLKSKKIEEDIENIEITTEEPIAPTVMNLNNNELTDDDLY